MLEYKLPKTLISMASILDFILRQLPLICITSVLTNFSQNLLADTDFAIDENQFKFRTLPQGESQIQIEQQSTVSGKNMSANFYFESYNYNSAFDSKRSQGNPYQENHFGLNVAYKNTGLKDLSLRSIFQTDLSKTQNSTFAVPELSQKYWIAKEKDKYEVVYLGRSTHFTSQIDQRLHLGLVHPYFSQDHINFETLGLTGIEYERASGAQILYFGFYPVFLPNQDPGVSVENGRVVAQNRWANQAPRYFVFNDKTKEINYEIKNYEISEVVFNPGYRFGLQTSLNTYYDLFSIGYKRAPMHNIVLARETYADLEIQGQVKLAPVVNYSHQFYSDSRFVLPFGQFIFSFIYDKPDSLRASVEQSIQDVAPMTVHSLSYEFPYRFDEMQQNVYITYAMLTGGQIQDVNSDGTPNLVTVSKNRQQYFNPIKIGLRNAFYFIFKRPIETQISYTYDDMQKGSLFSFDVKYELSREAQLKVGMDILGSKYQTTDEQASQYFLVKAQSFDRLFAGLSYVY